MLTRTEHNSYVSKKNIFDIIYGLFGIFHYRVLDERDLHVGRIEILLLTQHSSMQGLRKTQTDELGFSLTRDLCLCTTIQRLVLY